jgi:hypothetical protein
MALNDALHALLGNGGILGDGCFKWEVGATPVEKTPGFLGGRSGGGGKVIALSASTARYDRRSLTVMRHR